MSKLFLNKNYALEKAKRDELKNENSTKDYVFGIVAIIILGISTFLILRYLF